LANETERAMYIYGNNFTNSSGDGPNYHWDYGDPVSYTPQTDTVILFHHNKTTLYNYDEVCVDRTKKTGLSYYKFTNALTYIVLIYLFITFLLWVIQQIIDVKNAKKL